MAKPPNGSKPRRTNRARRPQQLSLFDHLPPEASLDEPRTASSKTAPKQRTRRPAKPAVERPAVLTPAEAAIYLNVKIATLKSWRAKRVGPAFVKRAARLIGYTQAALDAYLHDINR